MPIKQSELERKWYYRVLKVFLLLLPLILLLLWLLRKKTVVCSFVPGSLLDSLIPIAIGLVAYYLLLKIVRWAILYVVYGGIEKDTARQAAPAPGTKKAAEIVPLVLLLIIFTIIALAQGGIITLPKLLNRDGNTVLTPKPGPSCPATSKQTGTPCNTASGGVAVTGIIVPARCECPSDTTYASMDNITAGGPYRICTCN